MSSCTTTARLTSLGFEADNKSWLLKDSNRPQIVKNGSTTKKSLLILAVTLNSKFNCKVLPQNAILDSEGYVTFLVFGKCMEEINDISCSITMLDHTERKLLKIFV